MKTYFELVTFTTQAGTSLHNITPSVRRIVSASGIGEGIVAITSQHTTTAITINEDEERLREDIKHYFENPAPADRPYQHNDIHLRDCDPDEPENAQSHLIAMLLGSSESVAVQGGDLLLGQWLSLMMIELDGPRSRSVSVQVIGE